MSNPLEKLQHELISINKQIKLLVKQQNKLNHQSDLLRKQIENLKLDAAVRKINRLYSNYANDDKKDVCHKCNSKAKSGFVLNKQCENGHEWRYELYKDNFVASIRIGYKDSFCDYDFDECDLILID